jgi:hypothetical protein
MQKLSGTSSGKNNKSCRIIHHEPKKICFAFFRFFYDFLRNLQETGKSLLLFELPFCREALGKNLSLAMRPLGRPGQFRWGSSPAWPGKGWGGSYGPLGVDLEGRTVEKGRPGAGTPAARERRPPRLPVSGEGGSGKATGGSVGLGRG